MSSNNGLRKRKAKELVEAWDTLTAKMWVVSPPRNLLYSLPIGTTILRHYEADDAKAAAVWKAWRYLWPTPLIRPEVDIYPRIWFRGIYVIGRSDPTWRCWQRRCWSMDLLVVHVRATQKTTDCEFVHSASDEPRLLPLASPIRDPSVDYDRPFGLSSLPTGRLSLDTYPCELQKDFPSSLPSWRARA